LLPVSSSSVPFQYMIAVQYSFPYYLPTDEGAALVFKHYNLEVSDVAPNPQRWLSHSAIWKDAAPGTLYTEPIDFHLEGRKLGQVKFEPVNFCVICYKSLAICSCQDSPLFVSTFFYSAIDNRARSVYADSFYPYESQFS